MLRIAGADRYNSDKLPLLEQNVDEQISSRTFNLDANLALLRFYQFSPVSVRASVVAKVLVKAAMQLPAPDFKSCITLVPDRLQSDETVYKVVQMANALETCRFADFWMTANSCRDLLNSIPGFYESVRGYIAHIIGVSFQHVTKRTLADCLKLEGGSLEQYVSDRVAGSGWGVSGDIVALPRNDYNTTVVKRTQELIKFDTQVKPMLKVVTVGF